MKQLKTFLGGVLLVMVVTTGVAAAGYPGTPSIVGTDSTPAPGQPVTVTATGLDPGSASHAELHSRTVSLGDKTVESNGTVSYTFTVPSTFSGAHDVTITGVTGGQPVSLVFHFTVTPTSTGTGTGTGTGSGSIPRTGSDSTVPLSRVGIALLAVGGGAVYVARRRRTQVAAS